MASYLLVTHLSFTLSLSLSLSQTASHGWTGARPSGYVGLTTNIGNTSLAILLPALISQTTTTPLLSLGHASSISPAYHVTSTLHVSLDVYNSVTLPVSTLPVTWQHKECANLSKLIDACTSNHKNYDSRSR